MNSFSKAKVQRKEQGMESFQRHQEKCKSDGNEVFEVSLPLTVNRFHTLLQYSGLWFHLSF